MNRAHRSLRHHITLNYMLFIQTKYLKVIQKLFQLPQVIIEYWMVCLWPKCYVLTCYICYYITNTDVCQLSIADASHSKSFHIRKLNFDVNFDWYKIMHSKSDLTTYINIWHILTNSTNNFHHKSKFAQKMNKTALFAAHEAMDNINECQFIKKKIIKTKCVCNVGCKWYNQNWAHG